MVLMFSVPATVTRTLNKTGAQEIPTEVTFSISVIPEERPGESSHHVGREDTPPRSQQIARSVETVPPATGEIENFDAASAGAWDTLKSSADANTSKMYQMQREEALFQARQGLGSVKHIPSITSNIESVVDASTGTADALRSFAETWSSLLGKMELFTQVTDQLAEV